MGHHQFLLINYGFRHNQRSFNGKEELGLTIIQLSGVDVLQQLEQLEPTMLEKSQKPNMHLKEKEKILHVITIGRKRAFSFNCHIGKPSFYVII